MTENIIPSREAWLDEALVHITDLYAKTKEDGEPVRVPPVVLGVGFSVTKARSARGVCFHSKAASDGISQIFIAPTLGADDSAQILCTLIHEVAHAIDDCESGHVGRFRKLVSQMGLVAPFTSATAGEALTEILQPILEKLGPYPGASINLGDIKQKKQKARMLKLFCKVPTESEPGKVATCGYTVRTTQLWIDKGIPSCPLHDEELELEVKKT
jgi:hypothetical protein